MPWQRVCFVDDIKDGQIYGADLEGLRVMLTKDGQAIYANSRNCLHAGADLGNGDLVGTVVTCPLHFWKFDTVDGHCVQIPQAKIKNFPVKIENSEVYVDA